MLCLFISRPLLGVRCSFCFLFLCFTLACSFCGNSNSTHRETIVAVVVVGVAVARVEVKVARVVGVARVELGGPVVAVVASVVEVGIPAVASGREKQQLFRQLIA